MTRRAPRTVHVVCALALGLTASLVGTPSMVAAQDAAPMDSGHGATHEVAQDSPGEPAPRVAFQGFGDVQWAFQGGDQGHSTFRLGQFDSFMTARLSDRVSLLAEAVIEFDEAGDFFVDLERVHISFRASDHLTLRAGRYHTGVGYYSTAFHHGEYFATAATRPLLFAFEDEGGPLPIHDVGVAVLGQVPSGQWGLRYLLELGNGQRWTLERGRPEPSAVDGNKAKSTNIGLAMAPDFWPGFQMGGSFYRDQIAGPDAQSVGVRIGAVHAVYLRPNTEVLAEAIWMRHARNGAVAVPNRAFYVQVSRRFGRVRPFARYEHTQMAEATPLLSNLPSQVGPTIGVRFDPAALTSLKIQYESDTSTSPTRVQRLRAQAAFTF